MFSFCQLPAEVKFLKISLSIRHVLTCHVSFQRAPASDTPSATEAQSPCVSQPSSGWAGVEGAAAELSTALHMPGQGQEVSSASGGAWGPRKEHGSLHSCLTRPAGQSLLPGGWQGTVFPCAAEDGACECLKLELLR